MMIENGRTAQRSVYIYLKAITLVVILNLSLLFPMQVMAARYVDMSGNWAEKFVNQLADKGVLGAESDGRFRPNDPITRATLSIWLVSSLGIQNQPIPQKATFSDVKPTDWYYSAVEIVNQNNYILGYNDGFRPNQFIQRGEVIAILARTLALPDLDEAAVAVELSKYKDGAQVPEWARQGVAKAASAGILINHPDNLTIRANTLAKRADTAALVYRLDEYNAQRSIAEANNKANLGKPFAGRQSGFQYPNGQAAMAQGYTGQYQGQRTYPDNSSYSSQPQPSYPNQQQYQDQSYAGQNQSQQPYAQPQFQTQPSYQGGYPGSGAYQPTSPMQGAYPMQGQYSQPVYPAPGGYLQGRVAVVAAGTHFRAALINTLDSGSSQPGEQVQATLSEPLYANGQEVIPAGSRITGQVTNVVSARHFRFGANGRIDVRFTSIETPDGRRFPLSASIDANQLHLVGGSTGGRVGKGLLTTGAGAAGGAALGTGLGAITGSLSHGSVGKSTGMGAVFGTAMGSVVGLGAAAYRKGGEVKITAGSSLPVQLDESLQISGGPMPQVMPTNGYGAPVQQPAGGYYGQ